VKLLFDRLLRELEAGNWKAAKRTAQLIEPLDDVVQEILHSDCPITANQIADKVFALPWNDGGPMSRTELRRKAERMIRAAWSVESHARRIAAGTEEMLQMHEPQKEARP
jgi:hypothetical protein